MIRNRVCQLHTGLHCRIALLSDLHNTDEKEIIRLLDAGRPDLIAITGDLFLGYHSLEGTDLLKTQRHILPLLRECVRLAPTYISLGNHEWVASSDDLWKVRGTGAVVLDNRWVRDKKTGLVIGGMTSGMTMDHRRFRRKHSTAVPYPHERRHTDAYLLKPNQKWLRAFERQEGFKVLLCHHPEYWCLQEPMLRNHQIDLVLAGHAHGGQIRLFGRGLYAPGQGPLPRYTNGLHRGPYGRMIISRGLSNTAPPPIPRLFNPREIVWIDL